MAHYDVGITLTLKGGALAITIDRWAVTVKAGDTIRWFVTGESTQVEWFRIEASGPLVDWPFPTEPPDVRYFASRSSVNGLAALTGGRKDDALLGLGVGGLDRKRFPYSIAIGFNDEQGAERRVDIDPDMIVET